MSVFQFKYFSVNQSRSALKVGTDAMVLGTLISADHKRFGLDIGSGTGVLSLMVTQKNAEILVDAVELEPESHCDSTENFFNSPWRNRLNAMALDFLELETEKKYDLIFTNPPFFENSQENIEKAKTMARHTKSLPLDSLFEKATKMLDTAGSFWIILPFSAEKRAIQLANNVGLILIDEFIIEGKPAQAVRIVLHFQHAKKDKKVHVNTHSFLIRNADNSYSNQYKEATAEFHNREI
jgi:tRNA1Val (adenine37-N6)-methyltransferase